MSGPGDTGLPKWGASKPWTGAKRTFPNGFSARLVPGRPERDEGEETVVAINSQNNDCVNLIRHKLKKEVAMGSRSVFHKSEKRKKEMARQKKQEAKKLRKLTKAESGEPEVPGAESEEPGGADGRVAEEG
jgi:hypothetical protein